MDDQDDQGGSLVLPPRDYSDIAKLEDPRILEEFLDQPLTFIAETITGYLAVGNKGMMVAGGRIVQALLKGQLFKQWAKEFHTLRDAGKIPDDFAQKKYGFQTWVELMTVIDEETPDADRLEALKAMFYSVNRIGQEDKDRVRAYQLWRIAKQLDSGDLLLLKTFREEDNVLRGLVYDQWLQRLATISGFGVIELVQLHVARLLERRLVHEILDSHPQTRTAITFLGQSLIANIETYRNDLQSVSAPASRRSE